VIRNLEIIGQALKDYGINELNQIRPDTAWHQISAMRNVLAHEYLGVDVIMVWETVTAYIEPLQQTLEQILDG